MCRRAARRIWWAGPLAVVGLLLVGACAGPAGLGAPGEPRAPDEPRNVGFLVVDGVYNSELFAPLDVFQHTVFHTQPGMRVFLVGRDLRPVTTFEGQRLLPDYPLAGAPRIDVLVVPSAEHSMDSDLEDATLMDWVRERGAAAEYLLSLCDGAFVLAEAGLLEGRVCTTFPGDLEAFRARYPQLDARADVIFVHDGKALTSAGGARSYDTALYLVEQLHGAEAARGIGRGLVLDWDRSLVPSVVVLP